MFKRETIAIGDPTEKMEAIIDLDPLHIYVKSVAATRHKNNSQSLDSSSHSNIIVEIPFVLTFFFIDIILWFMEQME